MNLLKPKIWKPLDLICLKWSSILFGIVVGAYLSDFTRRFVWIFIITMILLAIKPLVAWFRNNHQ